MDLRGRVADAIDREGGREGTVAMISLLNRVDAAETLENLARELPASSAERVRLLHKLLGEPACRQLGVYPIPEGFKLSVVIPVYNEERWVREVVRRVQAVPIPKEIVIVEDCSTDGTRDILKELAAEHDNLRVFYQPH